MEANINVYIYRDNDILHPTNPATGVDKLVLNYKGRGTDHLHITRQHVSLLFLLFKTDLLNKQKKPMFNILPS